MTTRCLCCFVLLLNSASFAATYYVDSVAGSDSYAGTTAQAPWKTLTKVSNTTFNPGDSILFKCGSSWNGELWPKGSGAAGNPIRIDNYGDPDLGLPLLNGQGAGLYSRGAVYLFNQEYWEISNLEITNYDENPDGWKKGVYVLVSSPDLPPAQTIFHHIHLKNLVIHDVNGKTSNSSAHENCAGILFFIDGDRNVDIPRRFDDILVEGCHIYDVDAGGLIFNSLFETRSATENFTWTPSTNVVVRGNVFQRIGVWTIFLRVTDGHLVEYNLASEGNAPIDDDNEGNCFVMHDTDNSLWQCNEVYDHKKPEGWDGGAFDVDYMSKNAIVQYNYSHHNGMAFVAPCNGEWEGPRLWGFSFGHVFRYNISQNEVDQIVHLSGTVDGTRIYNNTMYLGPDTADVYIFRHKYWNGHPRNTYYYNNIVYNLGTNNFYDFGGSTNNVFSHNTFYGIHPASEPYDPAKLTTDPRLILPGSGGLGLHTLHGYKLRHDSPAIDSGLIIPNNPGRDFWGNPVPYNAAPDRGAHEYSPVVDTAPPTPNPPLWLTPPTHLGGRSVAMTAVQASDPSAVQYFFSNITDPSHNSGWIWTNSYTDTALDLDRTYSYRILTRDLSESLHTTSWSSVESVYLTPDTTPPAPDPMTWASPPVATGPASITMTAATASDDNPVEYYFANLTDPSHDSSWQQSPTYTDVGLASYASYTYTVKARDLSANRNETACSVPKSATTHLPVTTLFETFPSDPNPRGWIDNSPGLSSFAFNPLGYLDATLKIDPALADRYYFSIGQTYHKTQEFWLEWDYQPQTSTASIYQHSLVASLYTPTADNHHNLTAGQFSFRENSSGSTRYNRMDLWTYNSAGDALNALAVIDDPTGVLYSQSYRAKLHYWYDPSAVGKATLAVHKI
ncbi:MAG: hypothetical protein JW741_01645, partial [Sedimentisphaerales bacterium]|nr:hypothetical protein [Sedimentisphaerales bacterium]